MSAPIASETRKPVQREERDQRVVASAGESGGDEHRPDFVAVETGGVGLVVQTRSPDMNCGRAVEETLFDGVPVQRGDRAQPSRDRRPGAAELLEVASERLDVAASHSEQARVPVMAPLRKLPEIERVRLAGQPGVAAEEACERSHLVGTEHVIRDDAHHCGLSHRGSFRDRPEPQHPPDEAIHDQVNLRPYAPHKRRGHGRSTERAPSGQYALVSLRSTHEFIDVRSRASSAAALVSSTCAASIAGSYQKNEGPGDPSEPRPPPAASCSESSRSVPAVRASVSITSQAV